MADKDEKKVTTSSSTTVKPQSTSVEETEYYVVDANGNKVIVPNNYQRKVTQDRVTAPDAQTIGLFNEHVVPLLAKKHGVKVNADGEIETPLAGLMPYDVDAERKRREKEQELNEFRRKEANWYNGISVLMDIAGAAAGANVQKRTPTTVAADAIAANEALRNEALAEEVAIEQAKKRKVAEYWKDWQDQFAHLYGKVSEEYTEKPLSRKTKVTSGGTSTTTTTSTTVGGNDDDRYGNARYLGYTVIVNGQPENRSIPMDVGTYNKIGEDIIAHYRKLYNESTGERRSAIEKILANLGVRVKTKGGHEWRKDAAMSQGLFYMLPDELKREIVEKANGEIEFVRGEDGMDVIRPKVRPYIPDEEEEELMGQ